MSWAGCPAPVLFPGWRATAGLPWRILEIANLRMPIAAIGDQERDQRPHALDIGAVDDRSPVARAPDQAGAGEDAEMARERVLRTADGVRERASREADRLLPDPPPEDLERRGLTGRGRGGQRVRGRNPVAARHRLDPANRRQRAFPHRPRRPHVISIFLDITIYQVG